MADLAATFSDSASIQHNLPVGNDRVSAISVPYAPTSNITRTYSSDTASGTGANGALRYYQKSNSLVATTVDIDLTAAICSDGTVGLTHWRELRVWNLSTADDLTLGLGTNPITASFMGGTTPTVTIPPGGVFVQAKPLGTNGYVVDSTHKILRLNSGSATVSYRVLILGD